jgi:hypothetical protein
MAFPDEVLKNKILIRLYLLALPLSVCKYHIPIIYKVETLTLAVVSLVHKAFSNFRAIVLFISFPMMKRNEPKKNHEKPSQPTSQGRPYQRRFFAQHTFLAFKIIRV